MSLLSTKRTVDSTAESVMRSEAKDHLRVTHDSEDALIDGLVKAARRACEDYCGRAFTTQTWRANFKCIGSGGILRLPRPKLLAVSKIEVVDSSGVVSELTSSTWEEDKDSEPALIRFKTLPTYSTAYLNPIRVTYTAGFGSTAADVPEEIKLAIKNAVAEWYFKRVASGELPNGVRTALHGSYRFHYSF